MDISADDKRILEDHVLNTDEYNELCEVDPSSDRALELLLGLLTRTVKNISMGDLKYLLNK